MPQALRYGRYTPARQERNRNPCLFEGRLATWAAMPKFSSRPVRLCRVGREVADGVQLVRREAWAGVPDGKLVTPIDGNAVDDNRPVAVPSLGRRLRRVRDQLAQHHGLRATLDGAGNEKSLVADAQGRDKVGVIHHELQNGPGCLSTTGRAPSVSPQPSDIWSKMTECAVSRE